MNDVAMNSEVRTIKNAELFAFEDAVATGWGTAQKLEQFSNVMFEVLAEDTIDGTLEVFVSYQEGEPVWGDPITKTNRYQPIACGDLDAQSAIVAGSTGLTLNADGLKHYIVSAYGFKWVNFLFTRTDGTLTVIVNPYNNQ